MWPTADSQLVRFRRVLLAAQRDARWLPRLRTAELTNADAVGRLASVQDGLARLPAIDLATFLYHHAPPLPRGEVRTVPNGWRRRRGLPGEAIAGSAKALISFAARIGSGQARLPRGCRRTIVLSGFHDGLLSDPERDLLWQALELPVLEELRGFESELLAWECEGRDGLHLCRDDAVHEFIDSGAGPELVFTSLAALRCPVLRLRTGLPARLCRTRCPCGQAAERLVAEQARPIPIRRETTVRAGAGRVPASGL